MRSVVLVAVLFLAAALAGCQSQAARPQLVAAAMPYRLDAGDRLRIAVFGQQDLTGSYAVDAGGRIAMPLVGAIPARGLTTDGLEQAIAGELRRVYLHNPSVTVEIESYRPFFILGEVNRAGQYAYVSDMTGETAVAIAGGFTARARQSKVTVTRKVDGESARFQQELRDPILPGDTVQVQERWF
jgi:polysaccharide export outer membrane protein